MTAIGIVSAVVLARNGDAGVRPLEVQAIGQQFAWKFVYSDYDGVESGELVLPVGREARFTMTSVDVIHSFWVPNFGQKMDAVPGIETTILVTPDRTGEFAVVCAELCGLGHATMRAKARVVTEAEFDAWAEERRDRRRTTPRSTPTRLTTSRRPADAALLFGPGLVRGAWMALLFFGLGTLLVLGLRWWWSWEPVWDTEVVLAVAAMTLAPIGFLAGIGSFDYWLHYISGRPTRPEDHSGHGAQSWRDYFRVNTDHKVIGIQYLVTTFFFFTIGGLMAMFFRAELAQPGLQFVDSQTFNGLVSVHATLMIFLFIIPAFAGIANFAVPLMLGAPDMAFPRLNALSFWLLPIAGTMFVASFLAPGGAFGAGWTGYAPLAEGQPLGQTFFNMGVQWAGASSIMTALNFLVTIITMRAPGMTFWRMPLLVWANFTTSLLVVIATPFIAGSQFFVMFDRIMHTSFFTPEGGGYVLGYQHIFWFYSHPAVYIMMLPGFGIVSEVISTMSRKPIFGYRLMALSLIGILVLGFSVWAHHMFVAGMADWLRVPMMITTLLIAVPTGIKIFSWTATLWRGASTSTRPCCSRSAS